MTGYPLTRGRLQLRRLPGRPAAITALQLGFLAWAAVELAVGPPRQGGRARRDVRGPPGPAPPAPAGPLRRGVPRGVALQELGQVAGFWSRFPWWDTLVHTTLPGVLAPTGVIVLIRAGALPDVSGRLGVSRPLAP